MKVVHRVDRAAMVGEMHPPRAPSQAPPSWAILTAAQQPQAGPSYHQSYGQPNESYDRNQSESVEPSQPEVGRGRPKEKEPLFLPSSQLSQLPPAAEAAIIDSGLGIEDMTAEEFEAMLEGDAEEVEFSQGQVKSEPEEDELHEDWQMADGRDFAADSGHGGQHDSFELVEDFEMGPTQRDGGTKVR